MKSENKDEFIRALLSASGDCIKILDLDGKLRFMSDGGQIVMEVDDFSKLEGCPWPDFWTGSENPKAHHAVNEARAGRTAQFFGFADTARGNPRWWKVVVAPIHGPDGRPAQILSISTDITPQHDAERLKRESENNFAVIANSIPQMAWMTDAEGTINWYNQRWYEYTGVTPGEQLKGRDWRKFYHPDHIDEVIARHREATRSGKPWEHTFPIRRADGEYRWFLTRAIPIRSEDGTIIRWLGTNTDINDAREAVGQQRALMEELQHRVKNTLAIVQAIATQTFKDPGSAQAIKDFSARIKSLSQAHDRLLAQNWSSVEIDPLVRATVNVFNDAGNARVTIEGPALRLAARPALALAMVVHELGNNAMKYGSLSTDKGRVDIGWHFKGDGDDRKFVFNWKESDGPKVDAPKRRGLGSFLIEHGLGSEFGGTAKLDYPADGVIYTIEAPVVSIKEQAPPPA